MKYVLVITGILFGFLLGVYSGQKKVMEYESLSRKAISQTNECLTILEKTDAISEEVDILKQVLSQ